MKDPLRIVVTGGPGGGKTTALDLFRREIGDCVVLVPEAATLLFGGGFPRGGSDVARRAAQASIYAVQRGLEDAQAAQHPGRILLCDRGTIDGAVYWPGPQSEFFTAMRTTQEAEFQRYDAVLFFETAAAGGHGIETGNPCRTEDALQAVELDHALRTLWSQHSQLTLIGNARSFMEKVNQGVSALTEIVERLANKVKK